jgi:hypothetical protein
MYPGVGECVPSSVEAVAEGGPSSVEAAVEAWAPLILQGAIERERERERERAREITVTAAGPKKKKTFWQKQKTWLPTSFI